jgi:hypothetical protein
MSERMAMPTQSDFVTSARVDFVSWLVRLATWDGILPRVIVLVPYALQLAVPNRRVAVELAAVTLPIVAFLVRGVAGAQHIAKNNCSPRFRQRQYASLGLGIFMLVFIDCFSMLLHLMPRMAFEEYVVIYAVTFAIYLPPMAFALYPGQKTDPNTWSLTG